MLKEFKEFATKGNIMDLAIGVVIGGAFQKIVTSLVNDIIMPCISIILGKMDFSDLVLTIGNSSIKYGSFITSIIDFLIIAFSLFIAIRSINKFNDSTKTNLEKLSKKNKFFRRTKKKIDEIKEKEKLEEQKVEPTEKTCPYCYMQINYKATKCPHCTSDLEEVTVNEDNNTEEETE